MDEKYTDIFSDIEREIDENIKDIDVLYKEVKKHYDVIKGSHGKGTLNFMQGQTSNLTALKTAKANLLRDKFNVRKTMVDFNFKKEKLDRETGGDSDNNLVKDLASAILNAKEQPIQRTEVADENPDDILARRLRELENSGEISYSDNEQRLKFESMNISLVIVKKGSNWKFIAVDRNGKQVKDYPVPKKTDIDITFKENQDGSIEAKDENGKIYRVKVIK